MRGQVATPGSETAPVFAKSSPLRTSARGCRQARVTGDRWARREPPSCHRGLVGFGGAEAEPEPGLASLDPHGPLVARVVVGESGGDEAVQRAGDLVAADLAAALLGERAPGLARGERDLCQAGLVQSVGEPSLLAAEADGADVHRGDEPGGGDGQVDGPFSGAEVQPFVLQPGGEAQLALERGPREDVLGPGANAAQIASASSKSSVIRPSSVSFIVASFPRRRSAHRRAGG